MATAEPREPLINYRLLSARSLSYEEGLFGKARFAGNIEHIAKKCNEVQEALTTRPEGASRVRHCCVAALANMLDITCGSTRRNLRLRLGQSKIGPLALTDARSSE